MILVADENVQRTAVQELRHRGYDVRHIQEVERGIRSQPGGIVAATAGRLRSGQPAHSAEALRGLAGDAIAADVIERS